MKEGGDKDNIELAIAIRVSDVDKNI